MRASTPGPRSAAASSISLRFLTVKEGIARHHTRDRPTAPPRRAVRARDVVATPPGRHNDTARDTCPVPTAELLWTPSADQIERATLTRYQRWLGETRGLSFGSYADLWRRAGMGLAQVTCSHF